MRWAYLAVLPVLGAFLAVGVAAPATAGERPALAQTAAAGVSVTDVSAQSRPRRRAPRIRITRQAGALPPDAVRECQAWYVQERRPSGTVITPRMQCWWTR